MSDKEGLSKAYASSSGVFVHQDAMYLAGTRTMGDWLRNVEIPLHLTRNLPRYKTADKQLSGVNKVVGHSMGGSVALELAANHPGLRAVTYGAPVVSMTPSTDRRRDLLDPISVLDLGAVDIGVGVPHSAGRSDLAIPFGKSLK